jgi:hypothetical membrane protein
LQTEDGKKGVSKSIDTISTRKLEEEQLDIKLIRFISRKRQLEVVSIMASRWPASSIAGIVVIVLYCVFTFTSFALFPGAYNPTTNWLSDLGNSSLNPEGAIYYDLGCILTGIALFPFFIGLYKWYTEENWRNASIVSTQVVGSLAAFSLVMIGVFSEDYAWAHNLWSQVFFILNFLVLIMLGISLFTHPSYIKPIGYYGFIVAIINLLFVLFSDRPILEWFTVFSALGYVGLLAYNMLIRSLKWRASFA